MICITDPKELSQEKPSVVIIGKFDGLHRGHRKILACAREDLAGDRQLVMFTFSRSPQDELTGRGSAALLTREEKRETAAALGVDVLVEYPFTDEVRHMSAEHFLQEILLERLQAREIVAGPDCGFGYERRGNIAFLTERQESGGYRLRVVEKEFWRGEAISSTRIREALRRGEAEEAEAMLGCPFSYRSEIVHGRRLGRTLGFPTVNQMISPEKVIPAFGVYATDVILDGKRWKGISNVGVKPTVSGKNAAGVETYIYDFHQNVYGKTVKVELKHFVRPERRFGSLEELKQQVLRDKETVRGYGRINA